MHIEMAVESGLNFFEVKLRLIRWTDHKNDTPSAATSEEAQACAHYKIVEACAFFQ